MPTYQSVEDTVGAQLVANWSFTPVSYENVSPVDESIPARPALGVGTDPFIAVKVQYNTSSAAETGMTPLKRTWGNLLVEFYSKEDTGTLQNRINLDRLAAIFEYKTLSDIVFRDITVLRSAAHNGWFITPAMVRFYFNR